MCMCLDPSDLHVSPRLKDLRTLAPLLCLCACFCMDRFAFCPRDERLLALAGSILALQSPTPSKGSCVTDSLLALQSPTHTSPRDISEKSSPEKKQKVERSLDFGDTELQSVPSHASTISPARECLLHTDIEIAIAHNMIVPCLEDWWDYEQAFKGCVATITRYMEEYSPSWSGGLALQDMLSVGVLRKRAWVSMETL